MGGVPKTTTNITNKKCFENNINKEGFVYGKRPEVITKNKKTRLKQDNGLTLPKIVIVTGVS